MGNFLLFLEKKKMLSKNKQEEIKGRCSIVGVECDTCRPPMHNKNEHNP